MLMTNDHKDRGTDKEQGRAMMSKEKIFIGRQPILDRNNTIIGFELLFRSADNLDANRADTSDASVRVISNILNIGLEDVMGKHQKGFLKVGSEVLMSPIVELIPKDRMVIELLETIELNEAVIKRCRELKDLGYCLALNDFLYRPAYDPLLEIVDIVKVDLLQTTSPLLQEVTDHLKPYPVKLLAKNVEERQQFDDAMAQGFELFQGHYFTKPIIATGKQFGPSQVSVLKLLEQILVDADVKEIEETFKQNPFFSYNLLRLVNSVGLGMRKKIASLRQAIVILGREQLKQWAQLLLFSDKNSTGTWSPLMQTAAMRGKLMEILAAFPEGGRSVGNLKEVAFMTGILSVIDTLLERPMKEVVEQLSLTDTVKYALLGREGHLGKLLTFTEKLEQEDIDGIRLLLGRGKLELSHLFAAERQAMAWTNNLVNNF